MGAIVKKVAIFVEGQTELFLLKLLLSKLIDQSTARLEFKRIHGGRRFERTSYLIAQRGAPAPELYIIVFDCGSDSRVISDINDHYDKLVNSGYSWIIGLRDVAPDVTYQEKDRLAAGLARAVKSTSIARLILLAVMEVEAWVIGEHSHFPKINPALTIAYIKEVTGLDLEEVDVERLERPSCVLSAIYQSVGLGWTKSRSDIQRTISVIDFESFSTVTRSRVESLGALFSALEKVKLG